ncbi:lipid-A-disaccharide synthase [Neisseria sp. Ec49-e6-T10]|uniref:lipid-A-disaccharide synthase n=1 Tax=Neisseria sp. Ec49-e6-T10 TaxID=3140744 RepID=UPI003EBED30E
MSVSFSQNAPLKIGIVVGEASGDLLGAHLMKAILAKEPKAEFIGIGGAQMNALGFKSIYPQEKLAVRGLVEVLRRLPELLRIRKGVFQTLSHLQPNVFIGIDAPDFNLTLESWFKKAGIPTIHYVSPSVWAWRAERVKKIVKQVDEVLCLFPMEPDLYRQEGGQATFVGHPLAQMIPLQPDRVSLRNQLQLPQNDPVFTLMPGSRVSEIDYMAPIFIKTAKLLLQEYPLAHFLVPLATVASLQRFKYHLNKENAEGLPLRILNGHAQMAIVASDIVLVTSGTATLEVALCKRPMVISYRVSNLTYLWVKRKIKSAFVGLPNILLRKAAVPELLQKDATPTKLAQAMSEWYQNKPKQMAIQEDFLRLHESLKQDTDQLAAEVVFREAKYK